MQLVVHAPFGARMNRALGLALRKRFCRHASTSSCRRPPATTRSCSRSARPAAPSRSTTGPRSSRRPSAESSWRQARSCRRCSGRWRWNLGRALAVLRWQRRAPEPAGHPAHGGRRPHGRRVPRARRLPGERRRGADRNPRRIPSCARPSHDCLHEAIDAAGLGARSSRASGSGEVAAGSGTTVRAVPAGARDLTGKPYTYLDDAPWRSAAPGPSPCAAACRRRRGSSAPARPRRDRPGSRGGAARLPRCRGAPRPPPRAGRDAAGAGLRGPAEDLVAAGRRPASWRRLGSARPRPSSARGWRRCFRRLPSQPDVRLARRARRGGRRGGGRRVARPAVISRGSARATGRRPGRAHRPLRRRPFTRRSPASRPEAVPRGHFEPDRADGDGGGLEWSSATGASSRGSTGYTTRAAPARDRAGHRPDFVRFLLRLAARRARNPAPGARGLLAEVEQLQGFEAAAAPGRPPMLPARVTGYRPEWLDELCLSGEVAWGAPRGSRRGDRRGRARRDARPRRPDPLARHARQLPRAREPAVAPRRRAGRRGADRTGARPTEGRARVPPGAGRSLLPRSRHGHPSPARRGDGGLVGPGRPRRGDRGRLWQRADAPERAGPGGRGGPRGRGPGSACAAPPSARPAARGAGRSCRPRPRPGASIGKPSPRPSPSSSSPGGAWCSVI